MSEETKPEKIKVDLALPKETVEQRANKATFDAASIQACKDFVANMKQPGVYDLRGQPKKISAAQAKRLWGDSSKN